MKNLQVCAIINITSIVREGADERQGSTNQPAAHQLHNIVV